MSDRDEHIPIDFRRSAFSALQVDPNRTTSERFSSIFLGFHYDAGSTFNAGRWCLLPNRLMISQASDDALFEVERASFSAPGQSATRKCSLCRNSPVFCSRSVKFFKHGRRKSPRTTTLPYTRPRRLGDQCVTGNLTRAGNNAGRHQPRRSVSQGHQDTLPGDAGSAMLVWRVWAAD